ncbi:sialic acid-binding Ig-like lectin 10 [Antennarius striatus]|uniref:sialic acid-binding Ig-like lectin 10 n=1 Tax=Antennarius striatus TaxID=241820 RepID=UPI0035B11588
MMIILIWTTWIFLWRGCHGDTDFPLLPSRFCQVGFCINLIETITAEAGLCTVIPCSFTSGYGFTPQNMVWFKCEQSKPKCAESDMIFHPNKNKKIQSGFRGRVSLLEPDVSWRNCSIAISDLTESDSGSYQLRVNGLSWRGTQDGFSFPYRVTLSVKALTQKPTLMVPPLTEGLQTTLTCIAPGLCSGSDPKFTWAWTKTGNDSYVTGNITDNNMENQASVARKHTSNLTFNPSAEHHNTNVTCKVNFADNSTTEETASMTVSYVKEVKIFGNTTLKENETLNLTCGVESFPPSVVTWTKITDTCMQNGTETFLQNKTEACLQELGSMGTFSISNVSAEDAGQYICTANYLNSTLMEKVDVTVTYMRTLTITGDTAVLGGDALNLTCAVQSIPPSRITWSLLSCNGTLQTGTGSASLWISNVTRAHSGRYRCSAQYLDSAVSAFADVTVTTYPRILKSSGCRLQSGVLTCVCVSEGFPLPAIGWPLLRNLSEYSVITKVSKPTVNSTVVLNEKHLRGDGVQCASSNENGQANEFLSICDDTSPVGEQSRENSNVIYWLEIIVAFLIGVLLSAFICCLATKYRRIKLKSFGNLDETLEMVINQEDLLIDAGQAVEEDQTYYQDVAEERGRAETTAKASPDHSVGPRDVEYASIDFSVLKRKREMSKKRDITDTEYAEIRVIKEEREEYDREEGVMLEGREKEVMMGEDGEAVDERCCTLEEEEEEVYSNPKDMNQ